MILKYFNGRNEWSAPDFVIKKSGLQEVLFSPAFYSLLGSDCFIPETSFSAQFEGRLADGTYSMPMIFCHYFK